MKLGRPSLRLFIEHSNVVEARRYASVHLESNEFNAGKSAVCGAGRLPLSADLPTKESICVFMEHVLPHSLEIKRGGHSEQGDRRSFGESEFLSVR